MCDSIAIINHGRLIACESTPDLLSRLDSKEITFTLDADLQAPPAALEEFNLELIDNRQLKFRYTPSKVSSGQILAAISGAGLTIAEISTRETELEDIFMELTRGPDAGVAA